MEILMEYLAQGFMVMLMVSMPCVLVAAAIGLVVGILQAVTQVQEQTIAAAPKILGVFLVIIILGVGYVRILTNLVYDGTALAFNVIPKRENYVLAADYYKYTKPFTEEMKEGEIKSGSVNEIMKNPGKVPWSDKLDKTKIERARGASPHSNLIETNKILGR